MKKFNFIEQSSNYFKIRDECIKFVTDVLIKYRRELNKFTNIKSCESFEIVEYLGKPSHVSICGSSYDSLEYVEIPIEYFIDFDAALESHKKREAAFKDLEEKQALKKAMIQLESMEIAERELFERLKLKYESQNEV